MRGTKEKGEDDTVAALEGPQPRRGDETRGQMTPNRANTRARSARKDPRAAGEQKSGLVRGSFVNEGATEDAPRSVREILSAGDERGEARQAEGQQGGGTEAGKSAGALRVVSRFNVSVRSKRRGWGGRSEPVPEVLRSHVDGSDKQEGATDGS